MEEGNSPLLRMDFRRGGAQAPLGRNTRLPIVGELRSARHTEL
jgi:hypothetical protein